MRVPGRVVESQDNANHVSAARVAVQPNLNPDSAHAIFKIFFSYFRVDKNDKTGCVCVL